MYGGTPGASDAANVGTIGSITGYGGSQGDAPPASPAAAAGEISGRSQQRLDRFKQMLEARRAAAMSAFDEEPAPDSQRQAAQRQAAPRAAAQRPSTAKLRRAPGAAAAARRPASAGGARRAPDVYERLYSKAIKSQDSRQDAIDNEDAELTFRPEITPFARSLEQRGDVVDTMMRSHQDAKQELAFQREEKDQRELRDCTFKPQLNNVRASRSSTQIAGGGGDVVNRLFAHHAEKEKRLDEARRRAACERETAAGELTGHPAINDVSRSMDRGVSALWEWQKDKDQKLAGAVRRQKRDQRRKREVVLSDGTRRITDQFDRSLPIEDMLLAQGELSDQRKRYLRHLKEQEIKVSADMGPSITESAGRLERGSDVTDRLYQEAIDKRAAKEHLEMQLDSREIVDPETGNRLFAPAINPKSWNVLRDEPIEDVLFAQGRRSEEHKQQQRQRADLERKVVQLQPKLGPYSQLLVGLMEMRSGEDTEARLQKHTRSVKEETMIALEEREREFTFKPELNEVSHRQARSDKDVLQRLQEKQEMYKHKRDEAEKRSAHREMKECTFVPNIVSGHTVGAVGSDLPVHQRLELWQMTHDQKLRERQEQERERRAEHERSNCTFQPRLATR